MTFDKQKAKRRGLLLGTVWLVTILLTMLVLRRYEIAGFSDRAWAFGVLAVLAVQGFLALLLRYEDRLLRRIDPKFVHLPILSASFLLDVIFYVSPDVRHLLLLAWFAVMTFGVARSGLRQALGWSAFKTAGYLLVFILVRDRIDGLSPRHELAHLVVFAMVCGVVAITFARLRGRLSAVAAEQRRAQETLRDSEARLRQVIDLVPHFIFAKDREGRFLLANRALADAYGTTIRELIGKIDSGLLASDDDARVIDSGRLERTPEERITDARGDQRIFQITKIPFDFGGGRPAVLGIAIDITDIKAAETARQQLETQVQHLQKVESLGVLAGGIAHDFNNLLVGILGHAELAYLDLPDDSPTRRRLQKIVTAAERAAEFIDQMLAYSGQSPFVAEKLDLGKIVEGVSDLIGVTLSKKARFEIRGGDPVWVEGDMTQLHQVLINLVTNASDALEDRPGTIAVTTGTMDATRAYLDGAWCAEELARGEYAFVEVADDGCGMDAETLRRLFDPFFTTKFVGRGLGMAAVLGIVRGHHGAIRVDSEVGRGTRVRLLLPRTAPPDRPRTAPADEGLARLPGETLLVVDDDPAVRELVGEVLERSGTEVLLAVDGVEAVDLYRRQPDVIALVLLDLTMPKMNGEETFRALRGIRPEVRVVLMSGFNEEHATAAFGNQGLAGFLQKPFSPRTLARKIREVLAA